MPVGEYSETTVVDEHITLLPSENNAIEIFERDFRDEFVDEFPQAARIMRRNDENNYIKITLNKTSRVRFMLSYDQSLTEIGIDTKPDISMEAIFENGNHEMIDRYSEWPHAYFENVSGRRANYVLLDDFLPEGDYYIVSDSKYGVHVEEVVIYEFD